MLSPVKTHVAGRAPAISSCTAASPGEGTGDGNRDASRGGVTVVVVVAVGGRRTAGSDSFRRSAAFRRVCEFVKPVTVLRRTIEVAPSRGRYWGDIVARGE